MAQACEKAGYQPGRDVCFAMDAAASELYMEEEKAYYFPGESSMAGEKIIRTAEELTGYYRQLQEKYPIVSIEDGLCEEDWDCLLYTSAKNSKQIKTEQGKIEAEFLFSGV